MRKLIPIVVLLTIAAGLSSCKTVTFRQNYYSINEVMHDSTNLATTPWLKAHLQNGNICVLYNTWYLDSTQTQVLGDGKLYDFNRKLISEGFQQIPLKDIALFETNSPIPKSKGTIAAISVITGLDVLFGIYCITVPKACWGSCPTFYIDSTSNIHYADAEGFSNAILPSMQYADIDALSGKVTAGKPFELTLRNEALETHCIDKVSLLAIATPEGTEAFQTPDNHFFIANKNLVTLNAKSEEGDISLLLQKPDLQERFSSADEKNIHSEEIIYLSCPAASLEGECGLLLHFRQTLLPTYCFYNAMSYMGDFVGGINTKLETDEKLRKKFLHDGILNVLGGIDVYVFDTTTNDWIFNGTFNETGPIAVNKQVLPISVTNTGDSLQIKLVLNKGLWRIDQAAIATSLQSAAPQTISPVVFDANHHIDSLATSYLADTSKHMITYPGEHYTLKFDMPEGNDVYSTFLCSEGYYLEWMRTDWLADKNILKLRYMMFMPRWYLNTESSAFAKYEKDMEPIFWNSRISQPIFSSYEH